MTLICPMSQIPAQLFWVGKETPISYSTMNWHTCSQNLNSVYWAVLLICLWNRQHKCLVHSILKERGNFPYQCKNCILFYYYWSDALPNPSCILVRPLTIIISPCVILGPVFGACIWLGLQGPGELKGKNSPLPHPIPGFLPVPCHTTRSP